MPQPFGSHMYRFHFRMCVPAQSRVHSVHSVQCLRNVRSLSIFPSNICRNKHLRTICYSHNCFLCCSSSSSSICHRTESTAERFCLQCVCVKSRYFSSSRCSFYRPCSKLENSMRTYERKWSQASLCLFGPVSRHGTHTHNGNIRFRL